MTVTDQTPPAVTAPAPITVAAVDASGTPATDPAISAFLSGATAEDNVDGPVAAAAISPPAVFPLGETTVTFEATDAAGNTGTATSTATVIDQAPPVLTTPAAITVAAVDASGTPATNPAIAAFLAGVTADDNVDGPLTATAISPPAIFPLGETTVTFEATDAAGNTGTATSTVTVTDQTPPVVTAPAPITVAAVDASGTPATDPAIVAFLAGATAEDNVDGSVPAVAVSPPAVFALGETTVTFEATDAAGNTATVTSTVTVTDQTAPAVVAPLAITVAAIDASGAPAADPAISAFLSGATAEDNIDGPLTATAVSPPDVFPLGATTVTFEATDAAGSTGTATSTVTVSDQTPPVVTAPLAIEVAAVDGSGTPAADPTIAGFLSEATAEDDVDGPVPAVAVAPPAIFPLGETEVTFEATDAAGNTGTATSTVTVTDRTPPAVTPPAAITVAAQDANGAPATNPEIASFLQGATAADEVDGVLPAAADSPPGIFPLGETAVTFSATDAAGNTGTATSTVTVVDRTPPVVTPPVPLTLSTIDPAGIPATDSAVAAFLLSATAVDDVDGSLPATAVGPPAVFPVGATMVSFAATDSAGNTGTATSTLAVELEAPPLTLTLTEPAEGAIVGQTPVTVRGSVSDPTAMIAIRGRVLAPVDGAFETTVHLTEGWNTLTVEARQASGDEVSVTRSITLDTTPPVILIHGPQNHSIHTSSPIRLVGQVGDASPVTCAVAGQAAPLAETWLNAEVSVGPGANRVDVICADIVQNTSTRALTVFFDAEPLQVLGFSPPDGSTNVDPAASVTALFSEPVEPATVTPSSFFLSAESTVVPAPVTVAADSRSATLVPETELPAGASLSMVVTTAVTDLYGNPLLATVTGHISTAGTAEGPAVVLGEAFDDTLSLPLAGATVEALAPDTGTLLESTSTDEKGRYQLGPLDPGTVLRVSRPAFTSSIRVVGATDGVPIQALDSRLTPLAAVEELDPLLPSTVASAAGDRLSIGPGALSPPGPVGLTPIGPQGPVTPLPPGWAPLGIVEIQVSGTFSPPARLEIIDRTGQAGGRLVTFARFDDESRTWQALDTVTLPMDAAAILEALETPGQVALLLPDEGDLAPPSPTPGEALPGSDLAAIPADATASGEVTPPTGRADDPTPAAAVVTITSPVELPSGTLLRGDFSELFSLRDGGQLAGPDTSQDLIAYRQPDQVDGLSLGADFAIAASRTFLPTEIREGTVTVEILRGEMKRRTLVGPGGGGATTEDGSRIMILAGVLASAAPVDLARVPDEDMPTISAPGWDSLGALDLGLGGAQASSPMSMVLAGAAERVPTGSTVVVARVRPVLGRDRLEIVCLGRVEGRDVVTVTTADGVPFSGIRGEGRYVFLVFSGPLAAIAGQARDETGRLEGHLIEVEGLPLFALTDGTGAFALVSPPGVLRIKARSAVSGDEVTVEGRTDEPLDVIVIGPRPPRVQRVVVRPARVDGNYEGPVVLLGLPRPTVDDDGVGPSRGNGDGVIDPGERVELTVSLRNDGTIPVEPALFALRVRDIDGPVEVEPETLRVDSVPPGAPTAVGPFVFEAPVGTDPENLVYVLLRFTEEGGLAGQVSFTLPLEVDHPGVPLESQVEVTFSEPVVVGSQDVSLDREDEGALVPAPARLLPGEDGSTVTIRPLDALAGSALYRLTLAESILDADGRPLAEAPVVHRLSTLDTGPPAPIDPGRIEASVPDDEGLATITATSGSASPTDTVIAFNTTTGASVLATVAADGSFTVRVAAQSGDQLALILRDQSGNETTIDVGPMVRRDPVTGRSCPTFSTAPAERSRARRDSG